VPSKNKFIFVICTVKRVVAATSRTRSRNWKVSALSKKILRLHLYAFGTFLRICGAKKKTRSGGKKMNNVAPAIKEKIVKSGKLMVGYSPLLHRGMYNFFRMITTCHPVPTYSDMDYVIAQIQHFGEAL
jgi:hypothetical protein